MGAKKDGKKGHSGKSKPPGSHRSSRHAQAHTPHFRQQPRKSAGMPVQRN